MKTHRIMALLCAGIIALSPVAENVSCVYAAEAQEAELSEETEAENAEMIVISAAIAGAAGVLYRSHETLQAVHRRSDSDKRRKTIYADRWHRVGW